MSASSQLIDLCLQQAKYFLQETGEFYPFGTAIDAEGAVRPFGADMGEEFPKSSDVLQMLTEAVQARIADGRYRSAAICVDVAITVEGKTMDAVQISVFDPGKEVEIFCYSYSKTETGYEFIRIGQGVV